MEGLRGYESQMQSLQARNMQLEKEVQEYWKLKEELEAKQKNLVAREASLEAIEAEALKAAKQRAAAEVEEEQSVIAAERMRLERLQLSLAQGERDMSQLHSNEWAAIAGLKQAAEQQLTSAKAVVERVRQNVNEAKAQHLMEHSKKLEEQRDLAMKQAEKDFREDLEAAHQRGQAHRCDYPAYRKVWVDFRRLQGTWASELSREKMLIEQAQDWWLHSRDRFLKTKSTDLLRNYPILYRLLDEYYDRKCAETSAQFAAIQGIDDQYRNQMQSLGRMGHEHRALTKGLRMQPSMSNYQHHMLQYQVATGISLDKFEDDLKTRIARVEALLRQPIHLRRQVLRSERSLLQAKLRFMGRLKTLLQVLPNMRLLQSLRYDTLLEKELYFSTIESRLVVNQAFSIWKRYQNEVKTRKITTPPKRWMTDAVEEIETQRTQAESDLTQVEYLTGTQSVLRQYLGLQSDAQTRKLDAKIDHLIEKEETIFEHRRESFMKTIAMSNSLSIGTIGPSRSLRNTSTGTSPLAKRGKLSATEKELGDESLALKPQFKSMVQEYTPEQKEASPPGKRRIKGQLRAINRKNSVNGVNKQGSDISAPEDGLGTNRPANEIVSKSDQSASNRGGRKRPRRRASGGMVNFTPTPVRQSIFMAQTPDGPAWKATPASTHLGPQALSRFANLEISGSFSSSEVTESVDVQDDAEAVHADNAGLVTHESPIERDSASDSSYRSSQPEHASDNGLLFEEVEKEESTDSSAKDAGDDVRELKYRISSEDYRNAAVASPSTSAAFWSHKLYKNSEGRSPAIHYCTSFDQAEAQARYFRDEPVLGFDLEWEMGAGPDRSNIKRSVSLIQIASEDRIALFQIALYKGETAAELLPPSLRAILEARQIIKAGVNVAGDGTRLQKTLDVNVAGLFELSHLYNVVRYSENATSNVNKRLCRLADQVQNALLLPLKKDDVRVSAWSRKLRMDQLEYAASDAYAGFQLYYALEARRRRLDPTPPRPALYEDKQPLVLADGRVMKAQPIRSKPKTTLEDGKTVEEDDDDECQEYFDAVETLDELEIESYTTAGVPLAGLSVVYPTLPPLETAPSSSRGRQGPPPSAQITEAESWVSHFRASLPREYILRSTHPALRAYALWHEQRLSCDVVASLLRDPPLKSQTVAGYVLQAIKEEDLKYDVERVREVFEVLPKSAHGRFSKVVRQIGGL